MLHAKLVREGFKVNVKVVERIYREERLWLRRTKRKKVPTEGREDGWCPIVANQRWSLDVTGDAPANGRKFRTANLKERPIEGAIGSSPMASAPASVLLSRWISRHPGRRKRPGAARSCP